MTTPAAVASALHLSEGSEISTLLAPGPPWSKESFCAIVAWTGTRPMTTAQVQAGFAAGTFAVVDIETWAPASGLFLAGAQLKGFHETLGSISKQARMHLVGELHGSSFKPPSLGARAVGFRAGGHPFHQARAIWSKRALLKIIAISVRETSKHDADAALARVAKTAVPAFGL